MKSIKSSISAGRELLKSRGLKNLLLGIVWFIHRRTIRKCLPQKNYIGVDISITNLPEVKSFDRLFGWYAPDLHYEEEYASLLAENITSGETVTIIGAYRGLSPVVAALKCGETGSVNVIEPTKKGIKNTKDLANHNKVENRIEFIRASVGEVYFQKHKDSYSDSPSLDVLPPCDTLAIDCDGCELSVLSDLSIGPEQIIVEHHGEAPTDDGLQFEYDEKKLKNILSSQGYKVEHILTKERLHGGIEDKIGYFVARREQI